MSKSKRMNSRHKQYHELIEAIRGKRGYYKDREANRKKLAKLRAA